MARPPLALGQHGSIKVTCEGRQWVPAAGSGTLTA
jgi:hypothetical protein